LNFIKFDLHTLYPAEKSGKTVMISDQVFCCHFDAAMEDNNLKILQGWF
jgi:hypothetical protein